MKNGDVVVAVLVVLGAAIVAPVLLMAVAMWQGGPDESEPVAIHSVDWDAMERTNRFEAANEGE